jgi:MATE family multidrug resistance protein
MVLIAKTHQAEKPFEVTNRSVFAIAVPMTLAYLTTPLLGIADTAVVGQFADAALLGGLASGAIAFSVVFTTFNFLRSGTTGMVAQAVGAGNECEEQLLLFRFLYLALIAGVALLLLSPLINRISLYLMSPAAGVASAMSTYLLIRFWSAPAALANYSILGYVLGRGEGGVALILQIILNGTNILLSVYLGLVLGWGIAGVAWGTVGGELFAFVAGLAIISRRVSFRRLPDWGAVADLSAVKRMGEINGDIMIRSFSLLAAFAVFTRQGAQIGTAQLAANAVLMNFFMLAGYVLDGFATAAEQLAGRAIGARYLPAFDRVLKLTAGWGFAMALAMAGVFWGLGSWFVALMTASQETRALAGEFLPWAALTPVTGVLAFQMDGVFIGATWSRDMRNMMLVSLAIYLVSLPVVIPAFSNHGLWAALHLFLIMRGVSLLALVPSRRRRHFAGV